MRALATILAAASFAVYATGCNATCGVLPAPGFTTDAGVVAFSAPLGTSQTVNVPMVDSNPTANETLLGATLSGSDAAAFKVTSTFPMSLTAGTSVSVNVEFTPQHTGNSTASLVLDTENMGPSPIPLEGSAY